MVHPGKIIEPLDHGDCVNLGVTYFNIPTICTTGHRDKYQLQKGIFIGEF